MEREYIVFGDGPRILYAFHGFGRSAIDWEIFEKWLKRDFTVYSFYDFFHGKSLFPISRLEDEPLMKREIITFFEAFARDLGHDEVNLMAYSSGARTALTLIEEPPFKLNTVWLFAPDGIKISFWNNLFCSSAWVQNVFLKIVDKPFLFFYVTKSLGKLSVLNRRLSSFVLFNMRSKFKRAQLYNYWMAYKEIVPSMDKVVTSIKENQIKLHLIFGERDIVIKPKVGKDLFKRLNENAHLIILDSGHQLITENQLDEIMEKVSIK